MFTENSDPIFFYHYWVYEHFAVNYFTKIRDDDVKLQSLSMTMMITCSDCHRMTSRSWTRLYVRVLVLRWYIKCQYVNMSVYIVQYYIVENSWIRWQVDSQFSASLRCSCVDFESTKPKVWISANQQRSS